MAELIFWLAGFLIFYIYLGYPLVIIFMARLTQQPVLRNAEHLPRVSILIAAHNEAQSIAATLENKVGLDYPQGKIEILVVSDESEDGTDEIVERFSASSSVDVRLIRQTPRAGKTSGLNLLSEIATGELFAFSDANSIWADDALRQLSANFADPSVGYVTGRMVYISTDGSLVGDGCGAYMKYENWLREKESQIGSVVGVDGGVDMMRASLFEKLNADQLPDFVQPLKVVEKGYRVIYEPSAVLKEDALEESGKEYSMRIRVALRALWALHDLNKLLNPMHYGRFSWQLISHKLLRYIAFAPLLILIVSNLFLLNDGIFYWMTLALQIGCYILGWLGSSRGDKYNQSLFFVIPGYFILLNVASFRAVLRYLKGERMVIWKPREG